MFKKFKKISLLIFFILVLDINLYSNISYINSLNFKNKKALIIGEWHLRSLIDTRDYNIIVKFIEYLKYKNLKICWFHEGNTDTYQEYKNYSDKTAIIKILDYICENKLKAGNIEFILSDMCKKNCRILLDIIEFSLGDHNKIENKDYYLVCDYQILLKSKLKNIEIIAQPNYLQNLLTEIDNILILLKEAKKINLYNNIINIYIINLEKLKIRLIYFFKSYKIDEIFKDAIFKNKLSPIIDLKKITDDFDNFVDISMIANFINNYSNYDIFIFFSGSYHVDPIKLFLNTIGFNTFSFHIAIPAYYTKPFIAPIIDQKILEKNLSNFI